jgi:hypothetical protein
MPVCGTIYPSGIVAVVLSWTPGLGAVSETLRLYLPTGSYEYKFVRPPYPIMSPVIQQGQTYTWSIISISADGTTMESEPMSFTTPTAVKTPATDLVCSSA